MQLTSSGWLGRINVRILVVSAVLQCIPLTCQMPSSQRRRIRNMCVGNILVPFSWLFLQRRILFEWIQLLWLKLEERILAINFKFQKNSSFYHKPDNVVIQQTVHILIKYSASDWNHTRIFCQVWRRQISKIFKWSCNFKVKAINLP